VLPPTLWAFFLLFQRRRKSGAKNKIYMIDAVESSWKISKEEGGKAAQKIKYI
jgi:hypothetical protein